MGLIFKKFQFSQKITGKICCHGNHDNRCKKILNILIFFLIPCLNIFFFQMGFIWKIYIFHKKFREKICCHGNHDKMCLQSFENQSSQNCLMWPSKETLK